MAEPERTNDIDEIVAALHMIIPRLPGSLRYRFLNSLDHFDRSRRLFEIDREMASFRAITGEEEAASALMECLSLRRYEYARSFNRREHSHKAAVMACVVAIGSGLVPALREFQLQFDFERCRIDLKIPLSNFGVEGGEKYALQPVEPLDMLHNRPGVPEAKLYDDALRKLAEDAQFETIKRFVADQANSRNLLLYASDSQVPVSGATLEGLANRRARGVLLLVLTVMIWQASHHLALVKQAILACLGVMSKLPPELSA